MRKPYLSNETLGVLMVFAGGSLWGFSGACGQFLFQNKGMVSSWLVPVRLLSAGIILLAILGATRGKAVFDVWKDKKDAVHIVLYGLLGMSGCQFAYFTAVQYSNAGTATVLQYIGPALILLWLCLRQHRLPCTCRYIFDRHSRRPDFTCPVSARPVLGSVRSGVRRGLYLAACTPAVQTRLGNCSRLGYADWRSYADDCTAPVDNFGQGGW